MKRFAFTLAEVLITLGVIGVVAAIILPSVINNIQDRQLTAMWKKKYSEISNVYNLVKEEIGGDICIDSNSGDFTSVLKCRKIGQSNYSPNVRTTLSPEFVNKFVSHLKVVDSCGLPEYGESRHCVNYYFKWVGIHTGNCGYYGSLAQNKGQAGSLRPSSCGPSGGLILGSDMNLKAVLLADGSVIYFGSSKTGMISVDVNGFTKGPNVVGRDVFAVMVNEDWAKPLGADGTFNVSANGKTCECSKDYGLVSAQSFLGSTDLLNGTMLSGACCSAKKLNR